MNFESLEPYLTSPMWISLGLSAIMLALIPILIKFFRKDMWNNFWHIPYWHAYIMDGDTVLYRIIQNKTMKNLKVKSIEIKPYTWIIKDDSRINYKSASILFLDIKSCISISLESEDTKKLFEEIKKEKDKKSVISKIPIINRFVASKKVLQERDKLVGFATKIQSNPEFIINAVTLHIFLKQKFTNDIIKVPKTLWEILEENMLIIVVLSFICIMAFLFLQKAPSL